MSLHVHFSYPFLPNTVVELGSAFTYFLFISESHIYIKNSFQKVVSAFSQQQELAEF